MNIKINDIVINSRKRKLNENKVKELAESMKLIGQLEPITVTSGNVLLAGLHRVEAAKMLGWDEIKAELFEGNELECELAEIDENLMRNDLTVLEQGEHLARRQELIGRNVGRYAKSNSSTVLPLKTTAELAHDIGLSETSAQRRMQAARNIVPEVKEAIRDTEIANSTTQLLELARLSPDKQIEVSGLLQGEMPIDRAIREVKRKAIKSEISTLPPPQGKYRVLYADPPWKYNNSGFTTSAENQYPTMPTDEICNLPIKDLVDENAVLFLWATSPLLEDALKVCKEWGFTYKTNFVWVKNQHTGGFYCYGQHELLLIATKGSMLPNAKGMRSSVINAARREHSRKPDEVYSIIEAMYDGPYIELFARSKREGWSGWGVEYGIY